ncbi:MAG: hypothetical protein IT338_17305 [Thermomicrobiales bacterium]|nr:hypothetical protein [Thermomicrobiales bacterium]
MTTATMTEPITPTLPLRKLREILVSLPVDQRCDPLCPGWIVSEGNGGLRVERCDDCDGERRALGMPQIYDEDVRRLPEARRERLRVLAGKPLRVLGVTCAAMHWTDGTASQWRVYRVPVRGYPRPIKALDLNKGTVIATPTMRGDYTANQRGLAAQYATQEWPAFAWPSADDEIATLDRSNA